MFWPTLQWWRLVHRAGVFTLWDVHPAEWCPSELSRDVTAPVEASRVTGARGVHRPTAGAELPRLGGERDAGVDFALCPAGDLEQQAVQRPADQFGVAPGPAAGPGGR